MKDRKKEKKEREKERQRKRREREREIGRGTERWTQTVSHRLTERMRKKITFSSLSLSGREVDIRRFRSSFRIIRCCSMIV